MFDLSSTVFYFDPRIGDKILPKDMELIEESKSGNHWISDEVRFLKFKKVTPSGTSYIYTVRKEEKNYPVSLRMVVSRNNINDWELIDLLLRKNSYFSTASWKKIVKRVGDTMILEGRQIIGNNNNSTVWRIENWLPDIPIVTQGTTIENILREEKGILWLYEIFDLKDQVIDVITALADAFVDNHLRYARHLPNSDTIFTNKPIKSEGLILPEYEREEFDQILELRHPWGMRIEPIGDRKTVYKRAAHVELKIIKAVPANLLARPTLESRLRKVFRAVTKALEATLPPFLKDKEIFAVDVQQRYRPEFIVTLNSRICIMEDIGKEAIELLKRLMKETRPTRGLKTKMTDSILMVERLGAE
jgi:hypothetical protein